MINKEAKKEDFFTAQRIYDFSELRDLHNKIQRFWDEPRQVEINGEMVTARKFRHEDLHVAFGGARKVSHGISKIGVPIYQYLYNSERMNDFVNLWDQYEAYMKKQDWIEEKRIEELEKTSNEIPVSF